MKNSRKIETAISQGARPHEGPVNRPLFRGSTVTYHSLDAFERADAETDLRTLVTYGRTGNPNSHDFERMMAELEGGYGSVSAASGLAAITCTLLAFLHPGDHLLIVDSVYGPVRRFCRNRLEPLGIDIEYYDPLIGSGIEKLFREKTRMVYMESPGTKTFEIQDVPAIAAAAGKHRIITAIDNTWATPLFFQPLTHGVDVSIHAGTKYLVGHSDAMMGAAVFREEAAYTAVKKMAIDLGVAPGQDELYLALRGIRTLPVRLRQHQKNTARVIAWLKTQNQFVGDILYPALPEFPGHQLWKRDFVGASGLFGMVLKTKDRSALCRFVEGLEYFPLGFSWGGYESLILPCDMRGQRDVTPYEPDGTLVRLHIGLENPDDLIADLEGGFTRL